MIQGYLMAYLTAIAAWPVTLSLIGISAGGAFFTRRRGAGRSPRRSVHAGGHRSLAD